MSGLYIQHHQFIKTALVWINLVGIYLLLICISICIQSFNNIYRSDSYTVDNPIYIMKGLDADGNAYEQEVDASKINPNKCSFNELMVLNVENGHTSPKDYLHAVAVRENAGTHSYSQTSDYISHIESVMKDMKTLGEWDSYLAYDKWLSDIMTYVSKR